ncbi:MAG: DUF1446 domain-containing protein [Gammaproteobacteria bacterium]|nr:DUF1446 domain-containing protein [Gammaproteobacteria bacterium]
MLAASGQLGYGFEEISLESALASGVDFIGCDGGSMDPGPYYLGAGEPFVSRLAMRRDLKLLLNAAVEHGVPLVIGSAGGGGGAPHVAQVMDLVRAIAAEDGLHFSGAVIESEQSSDSLVRAIDQGRTEPLGPIEPLTAQTVGASSRVVAMMGVEPIQAALQSGAQVVIAGRCSDAAIFAAAPLLHGCDPGLCWHLAKIIECAGQVVEPRTGQDSVLGVIEDDAFFVLPAHPDKACTLRRVAAHTLYETPDPFRIREPGGMIDTSAAHFEAVDARTVKVSGSRFESMPYTVKLEGVQRLGYRAVFLAGVRDPTLIAGIDQFCADCHERTARQAATLGIQPESYQLNFRLYGRNAVMGEREPEATAGHELGIVADVIGDDEDIARAVLAKARYSLLHTDFEGRKCIAGNLGIPFSPSDISVGWAYRFSVWHTMAIDDPLAPFPISYFDL